MTIKPSQQSSQPLHEPIHQMLGQQDSFVQLLTAQFNSTHASTSFFHPNMWNQICLPQHMNLPNEDIPVRVAEHEDVEANTKYDPDCYVKNDSDENKIDLSDENIWYDTEENDDDDDYGEEPTFYDSGMWTGDCSFDHHNEAGPIANDPINAPPIETEIYEPRQKSTQRSDVRTDWSVPGVGDFSIESILEIIPSTNEHELYEGAMFKNKDELKTFLGKCHNGFPPRLGGLPKIKMESPPIFSVRV